MAISNLLRSSRASGKIWGRKGVLYRQYADDNDLRSTIMRVIGNLLLVETKSDPAPVQTEQQPVTKISINTYVGEEQVDELGILDYISDSEDKIGRIAAKIQSISVAMSEMTETLGIKTKELEVVAALGDRSAAKRVLAEVARSMVRVRDAQNDVSNDISSNYEDIMRGYESAHDMMGELAFNADRRSEFATLLKSLVENVTNNIGLQENMQVTILNMPRVTKELNSAKRALLQSGENYIESLRLVVDRTGQAIRILEADGQPEVISPS